jgi:voltage-gated potassium channel
MAEKREGAPSRLDRLLAAPMFCVACLFLIVFGALLHMRESMLWSSFGGWVLGALAALYVFFPLETVLHWLAKSRGMRQHWWFCLFPPARLGARDHVSGRHIWLPLVGWRAASRDLAHALIRFFSVPMICIALLVVPVLCLEFFFSELLQARPRLLLLVEGTSAFIWAAFVVEFVIVVSVVDRPWRYCRQNWINLAVIILPAIAFLRIARIGRLIAAKQIVGTSRVFRLRGLLFRAWRGIVSLDVIDMILRRDPEVRLERTRQLLADKEEEMDVLRKEIARLQMQVASRSDAENASAAAPASGSQTAPAAAGSPPARNPPP